MANLFIIGNGFDLAHGIKSSYNDFKKYLHSYCGNESTYGFAIPSVYSKIKDTDDIETARMLIKLITIAENGSYWSDLENSLGRIDYYRFFERNAIDEYNKMVAQSLEISIIKIRYFFEKWIKTINYSNVERIQSFCNLINAEEDYFITFNYTSLLEEIYGAKKVCHIHGRTEDNIIFGYGYGNYPYFTENDLQMCLHKLECNDKSKIDIIKNIHRFARQQGLFIRYRGYALKNISEDDFHLRYNKEAFNKETLYEYINNCIKRAEFSLQKNVYAGLDNLIQFLNKEHNMCVNKIYSIGFSYSDVDMKAIQLISFLGRCEWNIDNYSEKRTNEYILKVKKIFNNKIKKFDFKNC